MIDMRASLEQRIFESQIEAPRDDEVSALSDDCTWRGDHHSNDKRLPENIQATESSYF